MRHSLLAAALAVAGIVAPAVHAALPSVHSLGAVRPTPSGVVNSKYRNGDDGTAAIPLLWGACPSLATTTADSDSFNLRTLCNLLEPGSPDATLSLLSGTLPAGCVMATDGIDCTTPTAGSASVVVRATRGAATADVVVNITVTTAGTDSTAPTVPLGLVATDNADGTGTLSWDASSDPSVSGIATGVASYRVQKDGGTLSTITAPSANVQPVLAETIIGASDNESSSQAGADWTLTFGGAGLVAGGDHILGRLAQVTGDFVATAKITAYTPSAGTTGSIGIAARASTSANVIAAYARWKDSDDQCNLRYRWQAGSMSNGSDSAATYSTLPVWIRMSRSGDIFSAACSSDGNTWVTTSSHTISPGATLYVGPFITSGTASTTTATGTVAQYNVHQGVSVSAPITASGSYTVSSYDGTNRSSESAAVTATVTGGTPDSLVSVPAAPTGSGVAVTVCTEGCDYTPDKLSTALAQASSPEKVVAGSIIELRAVPAGGLAKWTTTGWRLDCDGVSGTSTDPIWLTVREGDRILLSSSTPGGHASAGQGLLDFDGCDYWNVVGSRDGTSGGLLIGDRDLHVAPAMHENPDLYDLYPNGKNILVKDSVGLAFVGLTISGSSSTHGGFIKPDSTDILFKYVDIGRHGAHAYDFDNAGGVEINQGSLASEGDSDAGEILNNCATRVLYDTIYMHHSGHTMIQQCGPYHIIRNSDFNGDWSDITGYPQYTGNHIATFLPMRTDATWNNTTHFGPLLENNVFRGVGSEPEHKLYNDSFQLLTKNAIVRGNYIVQRAGPGGYWGRFGPHWLNSCASFGSVSTTDFSSYLHVYHNTLWGGAVAHNSGSLPAGTYTAATCAEYKVRNNLFQGLQTRVPKKDASGYEYTVEMKTAGSNVGYANAWKGAEWTDNVFGRHPTDPPIEASFRVELGSTSGGSGGGTKTLDDCTTWPDNFCNRVDTVTWAQSGTSTAMANSVTTPVPSAAAIRAALVPDGSNNATMMAAAALTTVDAVTDGTHISLASARYFKDAWGFAYDWGGLHTEYGDCIAIGATAATAVTARITEINYATGDITITPSRTITNGWSVWKAADTGGGTCGAVWDTKGAAQ